MKKRLIIRRFFLLSKGYFYGLILTFIILSVIIICRMKVNKFSRSGETKKPQDFSDKLTKILDDAHKPWVAIAGISLLGLFMFVQIFTQ